MIQSNVNPKSLKKLTHHEGRPTFYRQKKTTHNITVTPDGWQGIQAKAQNLGYTGVSELVEQIGRGQVDVEKTSVETLAAYSDRNISFSGDDVQEQLSKFKMEMEQLIQKKMEQIIQFLDKKLVSQNEIEL